MRTFGWLMRCTGWATLAVVIASGRPVHADPQHPASATPVQREAAEARFKRGKQLLHDGNCKAAITELRASMEIVASPNARLLSARCLRQLDRLVEAYAELGRTSVEARELRSYDPRYAITAESAEAERREIESRVGFVILRVANARPDTVVKLGGEEVRQAAWSEPAPVMPGSVVVELVTPGSAPVTRTLTVVAGQRIAVELDADADRSVTGLTTTPARSELTTTPAPRPQGQTNLRPYAYVAAGMGVAGLATFAVSGLRSRSTYNQLDRDCNAGPCPADRVDDVQAGRDQQRIANIGLIIGLAGVVSCVPLLVLSKRAAPNTETAIVASPSWMGLRGAF